MFGGGGQVLGADPPEGLTQHSQRDVVGEGPSGDPEDEDAVIPAVGARRVRQEEASAGLVDGNSARELGVLHIQLGTGQRGQVHLSVAVVEGPHYVVVHGLVQKRPQSRVFAQNHVHRTLREDLLRRAEPWGGQEREVRGSPGDREQVCSDTAAPRRKLETFGVKRGWRDSIMWRSSPRKERRTSSERDRSMMDEPAETEQSGSFTCGSLGHTQVRASARTDAWGLGRRNSLGKRHFKHNKIQTSSN